MNIVLIISWIVSIVLLVVVYYTGYIRGYKAAGEAVYADLQNLRKSIGLR